MKTVNINENKVVLGSGGCTGLVILFILGYLVYGGLDGGIGLVAYGIVIGLTTLLAFIPFIGFPLQLYVLFAISEPWVFSMTVVEPGVLTAIIVILYAIIGIIIWAISSGLTLVILKNR